jgi:hypothetical protein
MEALRRVCLELAPFTAVFAVLCALVRDLAELVAGSDVSGLAVPLRESLELDFLRVSFFSLLLTVPFAPVFAPSDLLPLVDVRTGVEDNGDDTAGVV